MMKIAFIAAAAVAVLTTAPVITPAKAQGVDVQLGRDRDRDYDRRRNDYTVGVGPGGISVGPSARGSANRASACHRRRTGDLRCGASSSPCHDLSEPRDRLRSLVSPSKSL
jgi:hypothetical protein